MLHLISHHHHHSKTYKTFSFVKMWMMGCNNGSDFNFPSPDHREHYASFHGGRRLLRPLIPRPLPNPPPSVNRLRAVDFLPLNHHSSAVTAGGGDENRRDSFLQAQARPAVVASSRWNPAPEQLRVLEELYRGGTRTPSADQIQQITGHLRRHGKIEGKNVFYWFQNHKARERQKRRRQMDSEDDGRRQMEYSDNDGRFNNEALERNPSSASGGAINRTIHEFERTRRPSTNGMAQAAERTRGRMPLTEGELQRNATWQKLKHSPPPNYFPPCNISTKVTAQATSFTHTLQLFPLEAGARRDDDVEAGISSDASSTYRFFEFLPGC